MCFKNLASLHLQQSSVCVLFGLCGRNEQNRLVCDIAIKREIMIIHLIFSKEQQQQKTSLYIIFLAKTLFVTDLP